MVHITTGQGEMGEKHVAFPQRHYPGPDELFNDNFYSASKPSSVHSNPQQNKCNIQEQMQVLNKVLCGWMGV